LSPLTHLYISWLLLASRDAVKVAVANATSKTPFPSPVRVGSQQYLPTRITVRVVDKQPDLFVVVVLNERVQVIIANHGIRSQDIVCVWNESSLSCRGVRMHLQHVPNILRGSLEGTETYGDS